MSAPLFACAFASPAHANDQSLADFVDGTNVIFEDVTERDPDQDGFVFDSNDDNILVTGDTIVFGSAIQQSAFIAKAESNEEDSVTGILNAAVQARPGRGITDLRVEASGNSDILSSSLATTADTATTANLLVTVRIIEVDGLELPGGPALLDTAINEVLADFNFEEDQTGDFEASNFFQGEGVLDIAAAAEAQLGITGDITRIDWELSIALFASSEANSSAAIDVNALNLGITAVVPEPASAALLLAPLSLCVRCAVDAAESSSRPQNPVPHRRKPPQTAAVFLLSSQIGGALRGAGPTLTADRYRPRDPLMSASPPQATPLAVNPAARPPDKGTHPEWTPEASAELYGVSRWGGGYVSVSPEGRACMHPDGHAEVGPSASAKPIPGVDLKQLVDELRQRDLATPLLLRFPGIIDHRLRAIADAFGSAMREFDLRRRLPRGVPDQGQPAAAHRRRPAEASVPRTTLVWRPAASPNCSPCWRWWTIPRPWWSATDSRTPVLSRR